MTFVLDASATLALLLDEAGADVVGASARDSQLLIVNHCEVLSKIAQEGGDWAGADAILNRFGIRVVEFTQEHSLEAARLRPLTRELGLSLGDRACLAHGRFSGLPILTSDRRMAEAAAGLGIDIRMIR